MKHVIHYKQLIAVFGIVLVGFGQAKIAWAAESHFFGRWTVAEDKPAYSANGMPYKAVDIAPCGKDFCGVSVEADGNCGATLFRFLTIHANNNEITGHGRWGKIKKKITIGYIKAGPDPESVYLGLGDDNMDLSGREGSLPTFEANYKKIGEAQCEVN
ncbi:MAG: hypothetical protein KGO94_05565 [Alphaproteobacteria bacterium]|nr:hypothetical protein [Alphaproteobacteria bacterium]